MKTCKQCKQEKDYNLFAKSKTCKDGYDTTCKACRLEQKSKRNKNKKKSKQNTKVGFINPTIPLKKVGENGYGGKWNFDITKLINDQLTYAQHHGLNNHMSQSRIPCYQVKDVNKTALTIFCDFIGMNRKSIITFDKPDKPMYVVNLYHQDIVRIVK